MTRMAASKAQQNFAQTIKKVRTKKERIVLQSRGEDIAAVVPIEDLRWMEECENRLDAEDADRAIAAAEAKGEKPIPFVAEVSRRS